MANTLADKAVGSTVTLAVDGTARDFLVVQQGKPSGLYDDSCDGTWLLMKEVYSTRQWHSSNSNSYAASNIHSYLNGSFLALFDEDIQGQIRQARIPYLNGKGTSGSVASGAAGLSARIFLLSVYEAGWTDSYNEDMPADGACLAWFSGMDAADARRIAYMNGSTVTWWLRSADTSYSSEAWLVARTNGAPAPRVVSSSFGIRPALILPSTLPVDGSGAVHLNSAPSILSTSGASGTNIGVRNAPFSFPYTPSDPDGDSLTLTETLDGTVTRSFTAASGAAQSFAAVADEESFLKLANGAHTLLVTANDGLESANFHAVFSKNVTSASLTLRQPLRVTEPITVAVIHVDGSIPADASFLVEVTNNALDGEPVWQDATSEALDGKNIVFANHESSAAPAFNFRVTASRGSSGTGGYITSVSGAFQ